MAFVNLDATLATKIDPNSKFTIDSSTKVSFAGITANETAYVYHDMGAGFFNSDFTIRFILNLSSVSGGYWYYIPFMISKNLYTGYEFETPNHEDKDGFEILLVDFAPRFSASLWEDGNNKGWETYAIDYSTDYYVHLTRDDDGGTNGTGRYDIYICTGGYYGDGGSLVKTAFWNCSAGEQNDLRFIYWGNTFNDGDVGNGTGYVSDLKYEIISESSSQSPSASPSKSPSASPSKSPSASPSPSPSASPSLGPEFRYLFSKSIRQTIFIGVIPKPEISELEPSDYG